MRVFLLITLLHVFSSAFAEEVNIGHLETKDDIGINWLYFHCNKSSDKTHMQCDIIQTLMTKASTEESEAKQLKELEELGPLAEFNKGSSDLCKGVSDHMPEMEQLLAAGKDWNGKPITTINKRKILAEWPMIKLMRDVCQHPTEDGVRNLFIKQGEKNLKTCHVQNIYSSRTFTQDYASNTWTNQEGPSGPCGKTVIRTLKPEKTWFWNYVEREIQLTPNETSTDGQPCRLHPERTMNYTWRTTRTFEGCDYVESNPD